MANFKNITDLPVAESAEGINLIVNDNGRAKQIAASAIGGGGVKSWNDLEDKPFGTKTEMVEILPEESVKNATTIEYGEDFPKIQFTAGRNYIVEFDGKKYPVVGKSGADNGVTSPYGDNGNYLGNPDLTDEPFFVFDSSMGGECLIIEVTMDDVVHTLAIYEEQEVVKQLDPKFVGASGGGAEPDIVLEIEAGQKCKDINMDYLPFNLTQWDKIIAKNGNVSVILKNVWRYGDEECTEIYRPINCLYYDYGNQQDITFIFDVIGTGYVHKLLYITYLDGRISDAQFHAEE